MTEVARADGLAEKAPEFSASLVQERRLPRTLGDLCPFWGWAYLFMTTWTARASALRPCKMNEAIGLSASQFGWGAGMMFFSYCLLEVPSNIAMYHFGARLWLARIMITWGLAAAATAFAVGPISFYVMRSSSACSRLGFFLA